MLTFNEFADRYGLSIVTKVAKKQDGLFTREHVKYSVKIKSIFLDGKVKLHFQQNQDRPNPSLEDVLQCCQSDCSVCLTCDSCFDLMDEFGYDDAREASKVYDACRAAYDDWSGFLGEAGLEDFFMCEES